VRVLGSFRRARKAPLAVAAILATPLFFVGLMAFSLALEKPTIVVQDGRQVLGDPTGGVEAAIWSSAAAAPIGLLLIGTFACFVRSRLAVVAPAIVATGTAVLLLLPLDTWESRHTARYPHGVDLIPRRDPSDLILRGEWEENARRTAEQLSFWTVAIAFAAVLIAVALEVRRGRAPAPPPVAPPPGTVAGGTPS
jgi:hypothetical protein